MEMEYGWTCTSLADGDTHPPEADPDADTYCFMPATAATSAAKGSASLVPILMIIKFATSLKIDPGAWAMINSIQIMRAFTLMNGEMPANL